MKAPSMFDFYMAEVQSQWPAVEWMISGGMKIDTKALIALRHRLREEIDQLQQSINSRIGWIPNTKSALDMERLFHELGVTPRRTNPTKAHPKGVVKTGKEDMLAYAHRFPSARSVIVDCLDITSRRTIQSNFLSMALDTNDFYHPTYRLNGTKSGRFASEGADEGGPQGQNWPGSLLHIVIPDDPDSILIEGDLCQAEDMIIAYDANDRVMIEAFEKKLDSHRIKGCWIFKNWQYEQGLPPKELMDNVTEICERCRPTGASKCNHSERFISKSSGYAFKYRMGVRKFVTRQLPPAGVFISESTGSTIRDRVVSPPTRAWQEATDRELARSRWLVNLLGRKREFYGIQSKDGKMLRDALSWKAQSVVGILAGRAIARLYVSLPNISSRARLLTQRHDSVLVSTPTKSIPLVKEAIQEAFYSPIQAHGRTFNIPVELKSGPNWGNLH
jgi:DNA polymerase I-like protein with 3'-5' exonuclease and polymerase domains